MFSKCVGSLGEFFQGVDYHRGGDEFRKNGGFTRVGGVEEVERDADAPEAVEFCGNGGIARGPIRFQKDDAFLAEGLQDLGLG